MAFFLNISCIAPLCNWKQSFYSRKDVEKNCSGMSTFEVNFRTISAMREIGNGHSGSEKFCGLINLRPPMNVKTFNGIQDKVQSIFQRVADMKMKNAAYVF